MLNLESIRDPVFLRVGCLVINVLSQFVPKQHLLFGFCWDLFETDGHKFVRAFLLIPADTKRVELLLGSKEEVIEKPVGGHVHFGGVVVRTRVGPDGGKARAVPVLVRFDVREQMSVSRMPGELAEIGLTAESHFGPVPPTVLLLIKGSHQMLTCDARNRLARNDKALLFQFGRFRR